MTYLNTEVVIYGFVYEYNIHHEPLLFKKWRVEILPGTEVVKEKARRIALRI